MTSERPSVLERLKGYQAQLDTRQKSAPAKEKVRQKYDRTGQSKKAVSSARPAEHSTLPASYFLCRR